MYKVEIDSQGLKKLRAEHGISAQGLATLIGSSGYQIWRLECGRFTTSTEFLSRLIPVFGSEAVAKLIRKDAQRDVFRIHADRIKSLG